MDLGLQTWPKKKHFSKMLQLSRNLIFFDEIFFKPTLLDLKSTNLVFIMGFLPSAARYSPKKCHSKSKNSQRISKKSRFWKSKMNFARIRLFSDRTIVFYYQPDLKTSFPSVFDNDEAV